MQALKLAQIGNSVGLILPKEVLAGIKPKKGDTVFLTESPDGVRLTTHDPVFEKQIKLAGEIMKERRPALRELTK